MGRTYKKNDLHRSRRPKSIREKRNYSNRKSRLSDDNYSDQNVTRKSKHQKPIEYTDDE